jgi:signal transduction histidine kinase
VDRAEKLLRSLRRPGPRGVDGLIAAGFTVLLQAELWAGETYQGSAAFPGSKLATAPFLLVMSVALAWRRSRPIASLLAVMGAIAAQSLLTGGMEAAGGFAIVLISVYSAAAYGDSIWLTVAAAGAALAIHAVEDPYVKAAGDALFAPAFAAVGVLLGLAAHSRGVRSRVLAERAERLEREGAEKVRLAIHEERAAIARELHDLVAHGVSLMVVQAEAGQTVSKPDERSHEVFRGIERTGRETMGEMRRLLRVLREDESEPLQPQPRLQQVDELVERCAEAGVAVELSVQGQRRQLSPGLDLCAYRVIQEGLTNTIKHSSTESARVLIRYLGGALELTVADEGGGARRPTHGDGEPGYGLAGMRERVSIFDGELQAGPTDAGGFELVARLPVGAGEAGWRSAS